MCNPMNDDAPYLHEHNVVHLCELTHGGTGKLPQQLVIIRHDALEGI